MNTLKYLECSACGKQVSADQWRQVCECGKPLLARYDLEALRKGWNRGWIANGPSTMWRYQPVLPVRKPESIVSLGEGFTPLLRTRRLGERLGAPELWIKDDSINPTGTFKARGMSAAVSMAVEFGAKHLVTASAGNAGCALAAYASAAGLKAHIYLPRDVPKVSYIACMSRGADVTLVDGLVNECAEMANERVRAEGWHNVGTFEQPYRLEGKKTLGYELAEQFHWNLPDVMVFPTGGGIGIVGVWKAIEEMEALGFLTGKRPRLVAVQSAGCQPLVEAMASGAGESRFWESAQTVASGLRVPRSSADFLVLRALRASEGRAVAIDDRDIIDAGIEAASAEGVFLSPEGASAVAALRRLTASGWVKSEEHVMLFNTGTGMKYLEAYSTRFPAPSMGEADKLGGLITPR